MPAILQDWVQNLGLRHQGVLVAGIRGCDSAPRDDPSKLFVRCYRALVLRPHCGDIRKAVSFVEWPGIEEVAHRFGKYRRNLDHYPHHYVMHLMHAIEIVGYKYPSNLDITAEFEDGKGYINTGMMIRVQWQGFYKSLCRGLHVNPETERELDARLDADEESFGRAQQGETYGPYPGCHRDHTGEPPEKHTRPAGFLTDEELRARHSDRREYGEDYEKDQAP